MGVNKGQPGRFHIPAAKTRLPGRGSVQAAKPTSTRLERTAEDKRDWIVDCPVCGEANHLVVTRKVGRDEEWQWFLHCYTASCQALGGAYLAEVAAAVGARHGGFVKADPLRWLSGEASQEAGPRGHRQDAPFISLGQINEWHWRLKESPDALAYLTNERGLTVMTMVAHAIGYDGRAFTIPVFEDPGRGLIANVKRRYWPEPYAVNGKAIWKRGRAGASAQLYPHPPQGKSWLLCEGELDALLARQHGLPAVTSTNGTNWPPHWNSLIQDRRVAIVYDAGEASYAIAEKRAAKLRDAGVEDAWPVRLPLEHGEDLTDWWVKYGRTADELVQLIRKARRSQ